MTNTFNRVGGIKNMNLRSIPVRGLVKLHLNSCSAYIGLTRKTSHLIFI